MPAASHHNGMHSHLQRVFSREDFAGQIASAEVSRRRLPHRREDRNGASSGLCSLTLGEGDEDDFGMASIPVTMMMIVILMEMIYR